MVLVLEHEGKEYYACSICGLVYELPDYAAACEENCSGYGCCGLDVTRYAVGYVVENSGVKKIAFFNKYRYVLWKTRLPGKTGESS